jgi:hypothetical protein
MFPTWLAQSCIRPGAVQRMKRQYRIATSVKSHNRTRRTGFNRFHEQVSARDKALEKRR